MARQFDGSNDRMLGSNLGCGSVSKIALAYWLWWDSYDDLGDFASYLTAVGTGAHFGFQPNAASGSLSLILYNNNGSANDENRYARTDMVAAQWNHLVFNIDLSLAGGSQIVDFYVNNSAKTRTGNFGSANITDTWDTENLYLMSSDGGNFGAGRMAEVALWTNYNLTAGDVNNLYNGGSGGYATPVQPGNILEYWQVCGQTSPEPETVSGIPSLTVTEASFVTHPVNLCVGVAQTFSGKSLPGLFRLGGYRGY